MAQILIILVLVPCSDFIYFESGSQSGFYRRKPGPDPNFILGEYGPGPCPLQGFIHFKSGFYSGPDPDFIHV